MPAESIHQPPLSRDVRKVREQQDREDVHDSPARQRLRLEDDGADGEHGADVHLSFQRNDELATALAAERAESPDVRRVREEQDHVGASPSRQRLKLEDADADGEDGAAVH